MYLHLLAKCPTGSERRGKPGWQSDLGWGRSQVGGEDSGGVWGEYMLVAGWGEYRVVAAWGEFRVCAI
jgi:hypothetical protein